MGSRRRNPSGRWGVAGDLIVAVSAVPADRTVEKLVGFEPHVPTADFGLVHGAVHAANTRRNNDSYCAATTET